MKVIFKTDPSYLLSLVFVSLSLVFGGIETVSGGEGLIGEFHLLSCSLVVGAERLIRELGKEASLERERERLFVQAKGDIR